MYCTNSFEGETLEVLKEAYTEYYADTQVMDADIRYIEYVHDTGVAVQLPDKQVDEFKEDINEAIRMNAIEYRSQIEHNNSFRQPY